MYYSVRSRRRLRPTGEFAIVPAPIAAPVPPPPARLAEGSGPLVLPEKPPEKPLRVIERISPRALLRNKDR